MRHFIFQNWFRIISGLSMLMASAAFFIYSIVQLNAQGNSIPLYEQVSQPFNHKEVVEIVFSEDQLEKIIPKNEDGSINVRLSQTQLEKLMPPGTQSVGLDRINGLFPAYAKVPNSGTWGVGAALIVGTCGDTSFRCQR